MLDSVVVVDDANNRDNGASDGAASDGKTAKLPQRATLAHSKTKERKELRRLLMLLLVVLYGRAIVLYAVD